MIRRYVIVLNRVFLFTVHISRRLLIMETKMITACPIMLMTFSTAGVLHFGFTRIVRHNSRDVLSIVSSVVHCTIPSFLRFQRYACLLWRENKGLVKWLLEKHGPLIELKVCCIQYRTYFFLQAQALSSFSTQYIQWQTNTHTHIFCDFTWPVPWT